MESNSMLPFLVTQLLNKHTHIETKVYFKSKNTGLQCHYKSHVDDRYKRGVKNYAWSCISTFIDPIGVTSLENVIDWNYCFLD